MNLNRNTTKCSHASQLIDSPRENQVLVLKSKDILPIIKCTLHEDQNN